MILNELNELNMDEKVIDIVEQARLYILADHKGSFEHFAEWGLIAPKAW